MKRVDNIVTEVIVKDPVTKEDIVKPLMVTLELTNILDVDKDLELKFNGPFADYESIFKKNFGFTDQEEMDAVMGLINTISEYEENDQNYTLTETLNHYMVIKNLDTDAESSINLKTPELLSYVKDILAWIHSQDSLV